MDPAEGPGVRTCNKINDGLGMNEGSSVKMGDSPGLAKGFADKLEKRLADTAGLDEGLGVATNGDTGCPEGFVEIEERWSKIEALRTELNEGAAGRQQGK